MAHKRFVSITVASAALAASVLFPARPAAAATFGVHQVVGTMQMGAGLAYSCLSGGTPPSLNPAKCPPSNGNASSIALSTSTVGIVVHGPNKPAKPNTFEFGTFSLTAGGYAQGACDLMTGMLSGSIAPTLSVGTKAKARQFSASFTVAGPYMYITGTTHKGESLFGWLKLAVTGGSCVNKGPKTWTLAGWLAPFRIP